MQERFQGPAGELEGVLEAPADAVHNQAFNVGRTEENFRIRDLAGFVADTVPDCRIDYAAGAGPDKRCYRVDCGKLTRHVPTFRARRAARDGIAELYAAFRTTAPSEQDFEGPKFARIAHLRQLIERGEVDDTLRWRVPAIS